MFYVKPIVIGPDGLGCIDPDRRDRLPKDSWRPVPENPYWLRLQAMGDVALKREDDAPEPEEIEGYEAPAPQPVKAAPKPEPAQAKPTAEKGSDA